MKHYLEPFGAADGPENGTSTAKMAENAADGPKNGTSTALGMKMVQ
jgi:hypothetical protein